MGGGGRGEGGLKGLPPAFVPCTHPCSLLVSLSSSPPPSKCLASFPPLHQATIKPPTPTTHHTTHSPGLCGGFTGSYIFSQTIFTYRTNTKSRLCGLVLIAAELAVFLCDVDLLALIPLYFFAATLHFITFELMLEWLVEARRRMTSKVRGPWVFSFPLCPCLWSSLCPPPPPTHTHQKTKPTHPHPPHYQKNTGIPGAVDHLPGQRLFGHHTGLYPGHCLQHGHVYCLLRQSNGAHCSSTAPAQPRGQVRRVRSFCRGLAASPSVSLFQLLPHHSPHPLSPTHTGCARPGACLTNAARS